MNPEPIDELALIVNEVSASSNYRSICRDTIALTAAAELGRYKSHKLTVKAVKSRLHQITGAFITERDLKAATGSMSLLDGHCAQDDKLGIQEECAKILMLHKSSEERIHFMREFYSRIFDVTGTPKSILDIACGLNPFSIPWMGLGEAEAGTGAGTAATASRLWLYTAIDICLPVIGLVDRLFDMLNINGEALGNDVLFNIPEREADVAFIFKLLPLLERQERGSSARLLSAVGVGTRYTVATFPAKSMGGKEKGMLKSYAELYEPLFKQCATILDSYVIHNELVYILENFGENV